LLLEIAVKANFVLPIEKRLVVSFWTFSNNISATKANYKKTKSPKIFVDAGVSFYSKLETLCSALAAPKYIGATSSDLQ